MKKILTLFALVAIIPIGVAASVWQYGSYQDRASMAAECGIFGYKGTAAQNSDQKVIDCFNKLGGKTKPGMLGFSVVSRYKTTLSTSMTSNQTTVPVSSVQTFDGHTLTMADLGSKVFFTIEPGSNREEIVMCTGISGTNWTGCTRGLAFYGTSTTAVAANQKAHNAGSTIVMSNVQYVYDQFITTEDDKTSIASFVAKNLTATSTLCISNSNYCFRVNGGMIQWTLDNFVNSYNFTSSSISTLTASSTKGIGVTNSQILINASTSKGLAFGTDGYLYQKTNEVSGLYQVSNTTQDNTSAFGYDSFTIQKLAQTFKPAYPVIVGVSLYKSNNSGTPTSTVTVSIQSLTAGVPSGTMLASTTISSSTWAGYSTGFNDITFNSSYTANVNTSYAIVVQASTDNTSNYRNIGTDTTGHYDNGKLMSYGSGAWADMVTAKDMSFKIITDKVYGGVLNSPEGLYVDYGKNNTWTGTNIFATTTLTSTTVSSLYIGSTSTSNLINGGNIGGYGYFPTFSWSTTSPNVGDGTYNMTSTHTLGYLPHNIRMNGWASDGNTGTTICNFTGTAYMATSTIIQSSQNVGMAYSVGQVNDVTTSASRIMDCALTSVPRNDLTITGMTSTTVSYQLVVDAATSMDWISFFFTAW